MKPLKCLWSLPSASLPVSSAIRPSRVPVSSLKQIKIDYLSCLFSFMVAQGKLTGFEPKVDGCLILAAVAALVGVTDGIKLTLCNLFHLITLNFFTLTLEL
jgi:hypothetical protein